MMDSIKNHPSIKALIDYNNDYIKSEVHSKHHIDIVLNRFNNRHCYEITYDDESQVKFEPIYCKDDWDRVYRVYYVDHTPIPSARVFLLELYDDADSTEDVTPSYFDLDEFTKKNKFEIVNQSSLKKNKSQAAPVEFSQEHPLRFFNSDYGESVFGSKASVRTIVNYNRKLSNPYKNDYPSISDKDVLNQNDKDKLLQYFFGDPQMDMESGMFIDNLKFKPTDKLAKYFNTVFKDGLKYINNDYKDLPPQSPPTNTDDNDNIDIPPSPTSTDIEVITNNNGNGDDDDDAILKKRIELASAEGDLISQNEEKQEDARKLIMKTLDDEKERLKSDLSDTYHNRMKKLLQSTTTIDRGHIDADFETIKELSLLQLEKRADERIFNTKLESLPKLQQEILALWDDKESERIIRDINTQMTTLRNEHGLNYKSDHGYEIKKREAIQDNELKRIKTSFEDRVNPFDDEPMVTIDEAKEEYDTIMSDFMDQTEDSSNRVEFISLQDKTFDQHKQEYIELYGAFNIVKVRLTLLETKRGEYDKFYDDILKSLGSNEKGRIEKDREVKLDLLETELDRVKEEFGDLEKKKNESKDNISKLKDEISSRIDEYNQENTKTLVIDNGNDMIIDIKPDLDNIEKNYNEKKKEELEKYGTYIEELITNGILSTNKELPKELISQTRKEIETEVKHIRTVIKGRLNAEKALAKNDLKFLVGKGLVYQTKKEKHENLLKAFNNDLNIRQTFLEGELKDINDTYGKINRNTEQKDIIELAKSNHIIKALLVQVIDNDMKQQWESTNRDLHVTYTSKSRSIQYQIKLMEARRELLHSTITNYEEMYDKLLYQIWMEHKEISNTINEQITKTIPPLKEQYNTIVPDEIDIFNNQNIELKKDFERNLETLRSQIQEHIDVNGTIVTSSSPPPKKTTLSTTLSIDNNDSMQILKTHALNSVKDKHRGNYEAIITIHDVYGVLIDSITFPRIQSHRFNDQEKFVIPFQKGITRSYSYDSRHDLRRDFIKRIGKISCLIKERSTKETVSSIGGMVYYIMATSDYNIAASVSSTMTMFVTNEDISKDMISDLFRLRLILIDM